MLPEEPSSVIEFQTFLQKVRSIDLGPIAYQLMSAHSGPHWSQEKVVQAIARYLAFLYLIERYPDLQLVPSRDVDQVWHQHILDTSKYAEDCQTLFGRFIHHFPYLGTRGKTDQRRLQQAYVLTQLLFRRHFGDKFAIALSGLPSDCEPLQAEPFAEIGCARLSKPQQRPRVDIEIGDAIGDAFELVPVEAIALSNTRE